jgi:hypothetical protein
MRRLFGRLARTEELRLVKLQGPVDDLHDSVRHGMCARRERGRADVYGGAGLSSRAPIDREAATCAQLCEDLDRKDTLCPSLDLLRGSANTADKEAGPPLTGGRRHSKTDPARPECSQQCSRSLERGGSGSRRSKVNRVERHGTLN